MLHGRAESALRPVKMVAPEHGPFGLFGLALCFSPFQSEKQTGVHLRTKSEAWVPEAMEHLTAQDHPSRFLTEGEIQFNVFKPLLF